MPNATSTVAATAILAMRFIFLILSTMVRGIASASEAAAKTRATASGGGPGGTGARRSAATARSSRSSFCSSRRSSTCPTLNLVDVRFRNVVGTSPCADRPKGHPYRRTFSVDTLACAPASTGANNSRNRPRARCSSTPTALVVNPNRSPISR